MLVKCLWSVTSFHTYKKKLILSWGPAGEGGGGFRVACRLSLVACLNFKRSRVGALSIFHVAVGNFTLSAVATFSVMLLVRIYPGRASFTYYLSSIACECKVSYFHVILSAQYYLFAQSKQHRNLKIRFLVRFKPWKNVWNCKKLVYF